jgi:RNA polymerase sigma factor (sigma-70 family)
MLWSKKVNYTDLEIIEGFRKTDNKVLNYVYLTYFRIVESYILKSGGRSEDVKDIFQDGLSTVYTKTRDPEFELNCAFGTYLFSVCKNLWLWELRNRKKGPQLITEMTDSLPDEPVELEDIEILWAKKHKLFRSHFESLDVVCKKLILLFLQKVPFKEIAETMGFKSEMHAIRRKSKCKEQLIRRIKNDNDFKRFEDDS